MLEEVLPVTAAAQPAAGALASLVGTSHTAEVGADGAFSIAGVEPGTYTLRVSKDGFDAAARPGVAVHGGQEWILDEDLVLRISRGHISGSVVLGDGGDPSGVVAVAGPHSAVSGADGSFLLEAMPVGDYHVFVSKDGYVRAGYADVLTVLADEVTDAGELLLVPQTGAVTINEGARWTSQRAVSVDLIPPTGAVQVCLTQDLGLLDGAPEQLQACFDALDLAPRVSFLLDEGDGTSTIMAVFRDASGTLSTPFTASIGLDTIAPEFLGSGVRLEEGAATSTSSSGTVLVELTCFDGLSGVVSMRVSNDAVMDEPARPFRSIFSDHLVAQPTLDGEKRVHVVVLDGAGNQSTVASDAIVFDRTAPVIGAFSMNGGAAAEPTRERAVIVHLDDVTDNLTGIAATAAAETALDCSSAVYDRPAAGEFSFTLSAEDGLKTLWLCARDVAGNVSTPVQATNTVLLDTTAPSAPSLGVGPAATPGWSQVSTVDLAVHGGTAGDALVLDGDLAGGRQTCAWQDRPDEVLLRAGAGRRAVTALLIDAAGNAGPVVSSTVTVDGDAPDVFSVTVGSGDGYSRTREPVVSVLCSDGLASTAELSLRLEANDGTSGANLLYEGPYEALVDLSIEAGALLAEETSKVITATCSDPAGNASAEPSDAFLQDTSRPTVTSVLIGANADPISTSSRSLTVSVAAADTGVGPGYSVASVALFEADPGDCASGAYVYAPGTSVPHALTAAEGSATRIWVCAKDRAGHVSSAARASDNTAVFDKTAPEAGTLSLSGGASFTNADDGRVTLSVTGGETDGEVVLTGDLVEAGRTPWLSRPVTVTLDGTDGEKSVQAVLVDAAGNVSVPFSARIRLDREAPPPGSVTLAGGQDPVHDLVVGVAFSGTNPDTTCMWQGTGGVCGTPPECDDACFATFSPATTFSLMPPTGPKTVCWRGCDLAGNASTVASKDIELGTFIERPKPVLTALSEASLMALQRATYTVTLIGTGIAHDTVARVGDFQVPCASADDSDLDCGEPTGDCDTACLITVPDVIMRNVGTYVVRLATPVPVAGSGISDETLFLHIIAPVPKITRISPRGLTQGMNADLTPKAQEFTLRLWGEDLMDNVQVLLEQNYGEVLSLVEDPPGSLNGRYVEVRISTADLPALRNETYWISVINPPPGGGESVVRFGLNPEVIRCAAGFTCAADLRATRTEASHGRGVAQDFVIDDLAPGALVWSGGTAAEVRDESGELLARVMAEPGGSMVPIPFGGASFVRIEDNRGDGPAVRLTVAQTRGIGSFSAPTESATGMGGNVMNIVDVDADGHLDIVTATGVMLGDGSLGFADAHYFGGGAHASAVGDLDSDGDADYVCSFYETASVFLGAGDGTFHLPALYQYGFFGLGLADLDGDRVPDFATTGSFYNPGRTEAMVFRRGRGDGSFGGAVLLDAIPFTYVANVTDLDGDGHADLVGMTWGASASGDITPWLGDGAGGFDQLPQAPNAGYVSVGPFSIDLDGDAAVDLLMAGGGTVVLQRGNGDGTFQPALNLGARSETISFLTAGDLDGDGRPEILSSGFSWNRELLLRRGLGGGAFDTVQTLSNTLFGALSVVDLDADGAKDLVVYGLGDDGVTVLRGEGEAPVSAPSQHTMTGGDVVVFDLDGDGTMDLLTATTDASGTDAGFAVSMGRADGSFDERTEYTGSGQSASFTPLILADFNGDGNADAVTAVTSYGPFEVCVWPGDGEGGFATALCATVGAAVDMLATADLDGDAVPDLLAASTSGDMWLWRGRGDGTLSALSLVPIGSAPRNDKPPFRDLDGDGIPDLANMQTFGELLWRGRGDGSFAPGEALPMFALEQLRAFGVADFDGNGVADGATVPWGEPSVLLFLNDEGSGAFAPETRVPIGGENTAVAVADVNRDGTPDLVTSSLYNKNVYIRPLSPPRGAWTQVLSSLDAASLPVSASATTSFSVHQTGQWIDDLAVRVQLVDPEAKLQRLSLRLTTPRGEVLLLDDPDDPDDPSDSVCSGGSWAGKTHWRATYPTTPSCATTDLSSAYGRQRAGDWTLEVVNDGVTDVQLTDFAVITHGWFHEPQHGSTAQRPLQIALKQGNTGAQVHATTFGFTDVEDLSCAATHGDADDDARFDAAEHWSEIVLPTATTVDIRVVAPFDAAVEVRPGSCADGEAAVACDDDGVGANPIVTGVTLSAGTACVLVDGVFDAGPPARAHSGEFDLYLVLDRPIGCGDNVLDPGELCDDGNRDDADACSVECMLPLVVDDFDPGGPDTVNVWETLTSTSTSATASSGASSLSLDGSGSDATTWTVDTSACSSVVWRYRIHKGDSAPQDTGLVLEYDNGAGGFEQADAVSMYGPSRFMLRRGSLGSQGKHGAFKMRLSTTLAVTPLVDDFAVLCGPCRAHGDCPGGEVCHPATGACTPGCLEDAECSSGQICDETILNCRAGCREDYECGADEICDAELLTCRPGCRADYQCRSYEVCEPEALVCVPDCKNDDGRCPWGQICDDENNECREGCREDGWCGPFEICDPAGLVCSVGCRGDQGCPLLEYCDVPSTTCLFGCNGDHARCPESQVCDAGSNECRGGCLEDEWCVYPDVCDQNDLVCRAGCLDDSWCSIPDICDPATRSCVSGCRDDSYCVEAHVCDIGTWSCVEGCHDDGGCYPDQICDDTSDTCRAGCRDDGPCDVTDVCDFETLTCVAGCRGDEFCPSKTVCDDVIRECVSGCRDDDRCGGDGYCSVLDGPDYGQCVECRDPSHCEPGFTCDAFVTWTCVSE